MCGINVFSNRMFCPKCYESFRGIVTGDFIMVIKKVRRNASRTCSRCGAKLVTQGGRWVFAN
jgi:ribosomal protein S27AE